VARKKADSSGEIRPRNDSFVFLGEIGEVCAW